MTLILLLIAAILEVGGDALIRAGLFGHGPARIAFLAAGAAVLFGYGVFVNLSPLDFGRALGVYVALFFIVAQLVNWIGFGLRPDLPVYVGGALVCAGGLVLAVWR